MDTRIFWSYDVCDIWHVYGLMRERPDKPERIFYIGITSGRLSQRLHSHRSDPASAAYQHIKECEAAGIQVYINALESHATREAAVEAEEWWINAMGDDGSLVNRIGYDLTIQREIKADLQAQRLEDWV